MSKLITKDITLNNLRTIDSFNLPIIDILVTPPGPAGRLGYNKDDDNVYYSDGIEWLIVGNTQNNLTIFGILDSLNTTNSTDCNNGAIKTLGGIGIAKDLHVCGTIYADNNDQGIISQGQILINNTSESTSCDTGSFITTGGASIQRTLNVCGDTNIANRLTVDNEIVTNYLQVNAHTNTNSINIYKNAHIGDSLTVLNVTDTKYLNVQENANIADTLKVENNINTINLNVENQTTTNELHVLNNITTTNLNVTGTTNMNVTNINTAFIDSAGITTLVVNNLINNSTSTIIQPGTVTFNTPVTITNNDNSNDCISGSLHTFGGIGIEKDLHICGTIYADNIGTSIQTNGNIIVNGTSTFGGTISANGIKYTGTAWPKTIPEFVSVTNQQTNFNTTDIEPRTVSIRTLYEPNITIEVNVPWYNVDRSYWSYVQDSYTIGNTNIVKIGDPNGLPQWAIDQGYLQYPWVTDPGPNGNGLRMRFVKHGDFVISECTAAFFRNSGRNFQNGSTFEGFPYIPRYFMPRNLGQIGVYGTITVQELINYKFYACYLTTREPQFTTPVTATTYNTVLWSPFTAPGNAVLWEFTNFTGTNFGPLDATGGVVSIPDMAVTPLGYSINSLQLGPGAALEIWDDVNFVGNKWLFLTSISFLNSIAGLNNKVKSIRLTFYPNYNDVSYNTGNLRIIYLRPFEEGGNNGAGNASATLFMISGMIAIGAAAVSLAGPGGAIVGAVLGIVSGLLAVGGVLAGLFTSGSTQLGCSNIFFVDNDNDRDFFWNWWNVSYTTEPNPDSFLP